MPFNLLLLPLLGGFVFISKCNRFKFVALRLDGYRLLFHASVAGVGFLVLAKVFLVLITLPVLTHPTLFDGFGRWWRSTIPFSHLGVSILACVIGSTLWWPLNRWCFLKDKEAERAAEMKGDPLELFLRRVVDETRPVLLTLKSGKVYVGVVTSQSSPAVQIDSIRLLPGRSGYRDRDTRTVSFTTDYYTIYRRLLDKSDEDSPEDDLSLHTSIGPESFEIIIPVREIDSIAVFDPGVYGMFSAKEDLPTESIDPT
jgi:hypothetical protein